MAFVFACSQCGKRFQVHKGGVTVACPHCGSHEKIPDSEAAAPEATPVAPPETPAPPDSDNASETKTDFTLNGPPEEAKDPEPTLPWLPPAAAAEESVITWSPASEETGEPARPPADQELPAPAWMPPPDDAEPPPPWNPGDDDDDVPAWTPGGGDDTPAIDWSPGEPNPGGSSTITAEVAQTTTTPGEAIQPAVPGETAAPAQPVAPPVETSPAVSVPVVSAPVVSAATPAARKAAPVRKKRLSGLQLLGYYAAMMTFLCCYLLYTLYLKPPHQLESLPDIPPLKDGETQLVPENAKMPRFHTLALGEEQRYGNLRIKPVRVTRETVKFHSGPETVLRLWLELTNVSSDHPFVPIGEQLHDAQVPNKLKDAHSIFRANNFVARVSEKSATGKYVLLMPSWQLDNNKLNDPLPPGETRATALATEPEGIDDLKGPLVWRLHFRKGHNPATGHGVTTIIEVSFDSSEIQQAKG